MLFFLLEFLLGKLCFSTPLLTISGKKFEKIEIPKETIELFEDPNVCIICYSEKISISNKAQFTCGHVFCLNCVKNHLRTSITNGKVLVINCLIGGCVRNFTDEEIKNYMDAELFYKYRRFKLSQLRFVNFNRNYVNCPFPDCDEILEFDPLIHEDPKLECENRHKFCAICKTVDWHKGKCANVFIFK